MRIALTISSLGCGGAERVLTTLAGALASRGHHLALITLSNATTDFYTVPVQVERIALDLLSPSQGVLQAITSNVHRLLNLRRTLRECSPDVVLSFVEKTNILTLVSANDLACRWLSRSASIRASMTSASAGTRSAGWPTRWRLPS